MPDHLAIAIPTYNERENVLQLITQLKDRLPNARIFVVDDNSPDGTAQLVKELQKTISGIELLCRPKKSGLASAYLKVFEHIRHDESIRYVATMDADLSHNPNDLVNLVRHADNYDLVVGSRYVAGGRIERWSLARRALSSFGNAYARLVTGAPIRDLTAGFVVYNRKLLNVLLKQGVTSDGYGFQIEMKYLAYRHRATIIETPITFVDRSRGHSKLGQRSIWEGVVMPWYLRFFR